MNPTSLGIAAALGQSLIFIGYDLAAKQLREDGVDWLDLSRALRHAFFPALAILTLTWDSQVASSLIHDRVTLAVLASS